MPTICKSAKRFNDDAVNRAIVAYNIGGQYAADCEKEDVYLCPDCFHGIDHCDDTGEFVRAADLTELDRKDAVPMTMYNIGNWEVICDNCGLVLQNVMYVREYAIAVVMDYFSASYKEVVELHNRDIIQLAEDIYREKHAHEIMILQTMDERR